MFSAKSKTRYQSLLMSKIVFLFLVLSSSANSTTRWVDFTNGNDATGTGTQANPYKTITKGIAVSSTADTVMAKPATYLENISIGNKLVVISQSGSSVTTIRASASGNTVTFTGSASDTPKLTGFRVQAFNGGSGSNINCSGIPALVTSCTIDTAATYSVIGISVQGVAGVASSNTFIARSDGKYSALVVGSGVITQSTTWPKPPNGFCYLTSGGDVSVGGSGDPEWRLLPGTVLKVGGSLSILVGNGQAGRLVADSVVFTSSLDDTSGDADGVIGSTPNPGDWNTIRFYNQTDSASHLRNCIIRYGGHFNYGVWLNGGNPSISGCSFLNNKNAGLQVDNENEGDKVRGNSFASGTAATWSVRIHPGAVDSVVANNSFVARPDGKYSAILVASGTITQSTTWPKPPIGFCYLTDGGDINVGGSGDPEWRVVPGTVVKVDDSRAITIGNGSPGRIVADSVTFTSKKDDTSGDADGVIGSTPNPGDWNTIRFYSQADPTGRLTNCSIRYGGYFETNCAVWLNGGSPSITGCNFSNNSGAGLQIDLENEGDHVRGNSFASGNANNEPVRLHAGAVDSVVANNTFTPRPDGNYNALKITSGPITQSTTWPVPPAGFCYWLYGDYVELNGASAVWTLQPGTVIKDVTPTFGSRRASLWPTAWYLHRQLTIHWVLLMAVR